MAREAIAELADPSVAMQMIDSNVLLCSVTLLASVCGQLYKGQECQLNSGASGVCRSVYACMSAQIEITSDIDPVICMYEWGTPIVCCERPAPRRRPTPPRRPAPTRRPTPTLRPAQKYGSKSMEKCKEYTNEVYQTKTSPVLFINPQIVKEYECYISGQGLIIGGKKAGLKEFPHMAAIGYEERPTAGSWKCGGSLISNRFILTAAHCFSDANKKLARWARLGNLNLVTDFDDMEAEDYEIVQLIRHEGYTMRSAYNDIGLMKLDRDVKFSGSVRPACLNTIATADASGRRAIATGWGKLDFTDDKASDDLMKVTLLFSPSSSCAKAFRSDMRAGGKLSNGFNADSMICAGDPERERDTCAGDSGGPLQVVLEKPYACMYSVVGITSFGSFGCGGAPAVYTRVSYFVPWIEQHVWPN